VVLQNLCTKTPLFEGVEQPKKWPKKPGNALSDALRMSCFQNVAADAEKIKPRSTEFFETALRAELKIMNQYELVKELKQKVVES